LSGKPLLASLRRESPAAPYFPGLGHMIWFDQRESMPEAVQIVSAFLQEAADKRVFDRHASLKPFLASAMACRHVDLFNACVGPA